MCRLTSGYAAPTGELGGVDGVLGGGVYWNSSSLPKIVSSTFMRSFSLPASASPNPSARIMSFRPNPRLFFACAFGQRGRRVTQRLDRLLEVTLELLILEQRLGRGLAVGQARVRAPARVVRGLHVIPQLSVLDDPPDVRRRLVDRVHIHGIEWSRYGVLAF